MATLRYAVTCEAADDPESTTVNEWTAEEICKNLPFFAELFSEGYDDGFPSLVYTRELQRYTIKPLWEEFLEDEDRERAGQAAAS